MALLEHRTDVDHGINVRIPWRVLPDRRVACLGEKAAQGADGGLGRRGILGAGKGKDPKAPIRLHDMAEVNGLCIPEADHRRRRKTLADHESLREMLMPR